MRKQQAGQHLEYVHGLIGPQLKQKGETQDKPIYQIDHL